MIKAQIVIEAIDKALGVINAIGARMQWLNNPANKLAGATKNLALVSGAAITGLTGAAAATFLFGKHAADAADEIGDLAGRYGVATEDIQFFTSTLREDGGTMEDAAKGLGKLNRVMNEAIYKGGDARLAFEGAGISMAQLKKMTPAETLFKMADAFKNSTEEGKKLDSLNAIMGKSGSIFNGTLNRGTKELIERRQEMAAAGRFYNAQQIDDADKFDKAYKKMEGSIAGVKKQFAVKLYPMLTPILEDITKWIALNKKLINSSFDSFIRVLPGLIDKGTKAFIALANILLKVANIVNWLYNLLGPYGVIILGLSIALAPTILAFGQLALTIGQLIFWVTRASGLITFLTMTFKALWVIIEVNPIVALITLLIFLATVIYRNWDGIVKYVGDSWDRIKAMFSVNFFDGVIQVWVEAWQGLGNAILGILKSILPDAILPDAIKNMQVTYGMTRAGNITAAQAAASKTNVGGTLKIQIDSNAPAKVTELRRDSSAMDIDVNAGPILAGS